ncbi:gliding motility protein GldM [Mesonia sp. K7]|uniref:type IX secretion system motor protein PorM/GldM n=1 Tax=Mesonia sp. K7 TaxID=2218606 RepID=UPI000DA79477|nr:gliding motility protein GldM [Mesonia sp. K7]PZD78713.1 gliding motility protein GldM [Mesonia sp. K7]
MAGGKLSPRQKMINLMYLVFIAMMALNMSKEVLTAFGTFNESFEQHNRTATDRNNAFMAGLAEKAAEQPKQYVPLQEKAKKISAASNELYSYIENLKNEATAEMDDKRDYESMDKGDYFDELFYRGGKVSPEGQEFLNKIKDYRTKVAAEMGDQFPVQKKQLEEKFSTEDIVDGEKVKRDYINYHFVGFPLIASLTKLTKMQSDIKSTESEVLSAMFQGNLGSQVSLTNYKAIVIADKTAFFNGENFTGRVVLGRVDENTQFDKVIINGAEMEKMENGQVVLDFPAGNVGERELKGEIQFTEDGEVKSIPIESSYAVIPKPNAAVISADKMNVVYRGVQNPMTISIPGVPVVSANAPGLRQSGGAGSYMMDVTNVKAREVKINVSGELPNGETVSDSKTFRIKEIPRPVGVIGAKDGMDGTIRLSRRAVQVSPVSAKLPDFDFDLNLVVSGFKFQVIGKPVVQVNGTRLNGAAEAALNSAKRGDVIQIFDINAKISGNSSYKLPRVAPLVIELTD